MEDMITAKKWMSQVMDKWSSKVVKVLITRVTLG